MELDIVAQIIIGGLLSSGTGIIVLLWLRVRDLTATVTKLSLVQGDLADHDLAILDMIEARDRALQSILGRVGRDIGALAKEAGLAGMERPDISKTIN